MTTPSAGIIHLHLDRLNEKEAHVGWDFGGAKCLVGANKIIEDFSLGKYILYMFLFSLEFFVILLLTKAIVG